MTAWLPRPPARDEPVCWSWPVPPLRDLDAELPLIMAATGMDRLTAQMAFDDGPVGLRWWEFHRGARAGGSAVAWRCAVCGRDPGRYGDALVQDHCHITGQVRGWLCRSCNVREGRGSNRAVRRYRAWHPAAILDYHEPYDGIRWSGGWSLLELGGDALGRGPRPAAAWPSFTDPD